MCACLMCACVMCACARVDAHPHVDSHPRVWPMRGLPGASTPLEPFGLPRDASALQGDQTPDGCAAEKSTGTACTRNSTEIRSKRCVGRAAWEGLHGKGRVGRAVWKALRGKRPALAVVRVRAWVCMLACVQMSRGHATQSSMPRRRDHLNGSSTRTPSVTALLGERSTMTRGVRAFAPRGAHAWRHAAHAHARALIASKCEPSPRRNPASPQSHIVTRNPASPQSRSHTQPRNHMVTRNPASPQSRNPAPPRPHALDRGSALDSNNGYRSRITATGLKRNASLGGQPLWDSSPMRYCPHVVRWRACEEREASRRDDTQHAYGRGCCPTRLPAPARVVCAVGASHRCQDT